MELFWIYLGCINAVTFFIYGIDKWKAKKGRYRISEKALLILAGIGGSVGAGIGMWLFRHKTKKVKFHLGVPAIFLIQIAILLYFGIKM